MPKTVVARRAQQRLADAIRMLAVDAVEQAGSGHPGMPMGMADIATVLWREFLKHSPTDPAWPDRDRFVLSNGHGSMLLYALLFLSGYTLSLDDLRNFRRLGSPAAGHPEYEVEGIETTTGPLGQGLANAVGMALAERNLAAEFNRPRFPVVDHFTYVFLGDGCMMEGISHEVCSFAGAQQLGKLICFFDDNGVSIDGEVKGWCIDDTAGRFAAYGWHVIDKIDGHDDAAIRAAIGQARQDARPSLLMCQTIIGYGAQAKAGKAAAHGSPLGTTEVAEVRKNLDWPHSPFEIPPNIRRAWDCKDKGSRLAQTWRARLTDYSKNHPDLAAELKRRLSGTLPAQFAAKATTFMRQACREDTKLATRVASQKTLDAYAAELPELLGGSADLTESNLTRHAGSKTIDPSAKEGGNYVYYGVRELGMSAIMTGVALHGGYIPYGGTFLVFADYARSALRLAALMKQRIIFVYSHDSIGLGEDGPTHQPVEHLTMLRATPNLNVWRPADLAETAVAWFAALKTEGPSALVLSRQGVPAHRHAPAQLNEIAKGGYVLIAGGDDPQAIVIATGAEVAIARPAVEQHNAEHPPHRQVRLVAMPCAEVFAAQSNTYRQLVLPSGITRRLVVEAGSSMAWYGYHPAPEQMAVCMNTFGASAPAADLFEHYGFTAAQIRTRLQKLLDLT